MKAFFKYLLILPLAAVVVSCNQGASNETANQVSSEAIEMPMPQPVSTVGFQIGDQVPNDMVCMVNDEYMGKKQIPVVVGATTYYGCCDMCVQRIPNDELVRKAADPLTGEEVDKANAYIVLVNETGEVAYFSSKSNYEAFASKMPKS